MKRYLILLLFAFPILATDTLGQDPAGRPSPARRPVGRSKPGGAPAGRLPSPIEASLGEIRKERPELGYDLLFRDMRAIDASLAAIEYIFTQRGLTAEDAENATLSGWRQLRVTRLPPTSPLSPRDLINQVSGLGKLIIKSTPSGALIELDGTPISDQTEAVAWPTSGTHRIRLSKPGYETIEDVCDVEEGKKTEFHKDLPPVKR